MDNPDILMQLGVGGVFALFIIEKVFNFIKSRNINGNGQKSVKSIPEISIDNITEDVKNLKENVRVMNERVQQLYIWHDVNFPDQPGVKAWYTTPLYTVLKELSTAVQMLSERLDRIDNNH